MAPQRPSGQSFESTNSAMPTVQGVVFADQDAVTGFAMNSHDLCFVEQRILGQIDPVPEVPRPCFRITSMPMSSVGKNGPLQSSGRIQPFDSIDA